MTGVARSAVRLVVIVAVLYLAFCGLLFLYQRNLIYFPQPRAQGGGSGTFTMPVDGAQMLVTLQQRSGADALIYFGGNAEDVSYNLPEFSRAFPTHAIYLPDYRGYGGSSGKPSEAALVADSLALFDKVHASHQNIVVIGRSLGSGVALQLASQRPVARLVLITPYNSLLELAEAQFPWLPIRWIMQDKFESWKYAERVAAPTWIMAAEKDEIVPSASTAEIYRHFRAGVASLRVIGGVDHNTISLSPDYIPALQAALR